MTFPGVPASLNRLRAPEAKAQSLALAPSQAPISSPGQKLRAGQLGAECLDGQRWERALGNGPQGQQGRAWGGGAGLQGPAHDCWSWVYVQVASLCGEGPHPQGLTLHSCQSYKSLFHL